VVSRTHAIGPLDTFSTQFQVINNNKTTPPCLAQEMLYVYIGFREHTAGKSVSRLDAGKTGFLKINKEIDCTRTKEKGMVGVLIAEGHPGVRSQLAEIFIQAGYDVTVTSSAANALHGILKRSAQVVLLGNELDDLKAGDLVPLLKKCNNNIPIILVSDEDSLASIRKVREEGIFYHALKPVKNEDWDEIRQAVRCAIDNLMRSQSTH
jgi:CheY-like chemotaxis protein